MDRIRDWWSENYKPFVVLLVGTLLIGLNSFWVGMASRSRIFYALFPVFGALTILALLLQPYLGVVAIMAIQPVAHVLPTLPFVGTPTVAFGLVTLAAFLLKTSTGSVRIKIANRLIYVLIALFVATTIISSFRSNPALVSRIAMTYVLLLIFLFLADQLLTDQHRIHILMVCFMLTTMLTAVVGGIYQIRNPSTAPGSDRLSGLTGNANQMGIYAGMTIIMSIYFLIYYRNQNRNLFFVRVFAWLSLAFGGVAMVLSGSRGAVLFLLPLVVLFPFIGRIKLYVLVPFGIALALAINLAFTRFIPQTYIERIQTISSVIINREDTVGVRLRYWEVALNLWKQSPVWGIGPGGFMEYSRENPIEVFGFSALYLESPWTVTHNGYLTILTEEGVIGFVLFVSIMLVAGAGYAKLLGSTMKLPVPREYYGLVLAWGGCFLYLAMNMIKVNNEADKVAWFMIIMPFVILKLVQQYVQPDAASGS